MTLEQLRAFVAVAEKEHLTRGAEVLRATESTIRAAIGNLESAHGARLFDRNGRRIRLTESGRIFLTYAKRLVAGADAAEVVLKDLGASPKGAVCLGASHTIASYWLPVRLVAFRKAFPDVEVHVRLGNTGQVAEWVTEGAVQIGLIEGPVSESNFVEVIIGVDQLCLVVASGHEWSCAGHAELDLLSAEWVLRERGSSTRSEFENVLRVRGIDPSALNVSMELPSNEAVREAVEAGAGAGVLSEFVVERSFRLGSLRRIPIDLPRRAFRAVSHREKYQSQTMAAFAAFLQRTSSSRSVSQACVS